MTPTRTADVLNPFLLHIADKENPRTRIATDGWSAYQVGIPERMHIIVPHTTIRCNVCVKCNEGKNTRCARCKVCPCLEKKNKRKAEAQAKKVGVMDAKVLK
eukprot:Hpha_TRINITY_DN252_c0_g1::TRINITY_DN252_c0_g1_i1::g.83518::m.83518